MMRAEKAPGIIMAVVSKGGGALANSDDRETGTSILYGPSGRATGRMPDSITMLRTLGPLAVKSWARDPETGEPVARGYDSAKNFRCEVQPIGGIEELSALLIELERARTTFIIRGELVPGSENADGTVWRQHLPNKEDGKVRFKEPEGGRRWAMLDFDKVEMPTAVDLIGDPEGAVEHLIGRLPSAFQDVSFHWQLSASAGMGSRDQLSAHVWFWLDRGVTDTELKAWVRSTGLPIDTALFTPTQPHYTGTPIFQRGLVDPLRRRSGLWRGLWDDVEFPEVEFPEPSEPGSSGGGSPLSDVHGFGGKLALLGDGAGLRGFHAVLRDSVASWAGSLSIDDATSQQEALKAWLRDAIDAAPKNPGRPSSEIQRYKSNKYLDDIIGGAIDKFSRVPMETSPHFDPDFVSADEAGRLIRQHVAGFFNAVAERGPEDPAPQVGIRSSAGVGKTKLVIDGLIALPDLAKRNIHVFAPTHRLCEEWLERLQDAAKAAGAHVRARVMRGRSHGAPDEPMCAKWAFAEEVAQRGLPVRTTLCERTRKKPNVDGEKSEPIIERCEHFDACPYIAQFQDLRPAIRIWPHEYLALPRPAGVPDPGFVVVDERFWPVLVDDDSFGLDRLVADHGWQPHRLGESDWLPAPGRDVMMSPMDVVRTLSWDTRAALEAGQPLKPALRGLGYTKEHLQRAQKVELTARTFHSIHPDQPIEQQQAALALTPDPEALVFWRLWSLMESEWDLPGDDFVRIELRRAWPEPGSGEKRDRVFLHWQREAWASGFPVLIIDADVDQRITGIFLPELVVHEVAVDRRAHVVQIRDTTVSKHKLLTAPKADDRLADVQALIDAVAWAGSRALVAAPKGIADKLAPPAGAELTHFGALRGADRWRNLDTSIIVGREQPSVDAIEGLMRALFWDRPEPLQLVKPNDQGRRFLTETARGYRMRDGSLRGSRVWVHPDPDGQRVLEQIRECESAQAIDRLRLIHGDEKTVIVVSSTPLDLTVDELVTWSELMPCRITRALMKHGAVPLSGSEAARSCPGFWKTSKAAEHDISRSKIKYSQPLNGKYPQTFNYIQLRVWGYLINCTYRRPGQRGRASRAIVDCRHGDPRRTLEQLVGPIHSFTVETVEDASDETTVAKAETPHAAGGIHRMLTL